jgi:methylmalonyl-CoA carboxyltransferase 12S subunit
MARTTTKSLAEILEQVQIQLAVLSERVQKLEALQLQDTASGPKQAPAALVAQEPPPEPEIAEEEMIAISAALAAYLGVRVRIRQIRLLSSPAWAQQGRVSIQASHKLH